MKNPFPEHFHLKGKCVGYFWHLFWRLEVQNFWIKLPLAREDVSVAKQIVFNSISYVSLQVAAALQAQQQLQNNSSSNSTSINSTSNSGSQPPMSNSMMKSPTNNNLISTTSTTSANTHSSSQSLVSSLHSHFGGSSQLSSNEASAVSQIWKKKFRYWYQMFWEGHFLLTLLDDFKKRGEIFSILWPFHNI